MPLPCHPPLAIGFFLELPMANGGGLFSAPCGEMTLNDSY
jgi:hypothetical protein